MGERAQEWVCGNDIISTEGLRQAKWVQPFWVIFRSRMDFIQFLLCWLTLFFLVLPFFSFPVFSVFLLLYSFSPSFIPTSLPILFVPLLLTLFIFSSCFLCVHYADYFCSSLVSDYTATIMPFILPSFYPSLHPFSTRSSISSFIFFFFPLSIIFLQFFIFVFFPFSSFFPISCVIFLNYLWNISVISWH